MSRNSIKFKLLSYMMIVSVCAVLLYVMLSTLWGAYSLNQESEKELTLNAQLLGSRNAAALAFNNHAFVKDTLEVLAEKNNITSACIFDREGKIVAAYKDSYERCGISQRNWNGTFKEQTSSDWRELKVSRNIFSEGEVIGSILLISNQQKLHDYVYDQLLIALFILLSTSLAAFILASYLQRFISKPIIEIVTATENLSKNPSQPCHLPNYSAQELARLSNSLKLMLGHIANAQLQQQFELNKLRNALRANNQSMKLLYKALSGPCNSADVVSELLTNKPMGNDLENYQPYVNDVKSALTDYNFIMESIISLSEEYESALQCVKLPIPIVSTIEEKIQILRKQELFGSFEISIDNALLKRRKELVFNLHEKAWIRLNNIIFGFLPTVLNIDSQKMLMHISYEEDNNSGKLTFDIHPSEESRGDYESCNNLNELISKFKSGEMRSEANNLSQTEAPNFFNDDLFHYEDYKFLLDCAKYIANVNDICIHSALEYPLFLLSYSFDLSSKSAVVKNSALYSIADNDDQTRNI